MERQPAFPLDENFLLKKLKERDSQAFQLFYEQYSSAMYSVILRIVRNEEQAQDLLQGVFVKIWNNVDAFDLGRSKLFTWLLDVAKEEAMNALRTPEENSRKERNTHVWFRSISLENVRSFGTKQTIVFTDKDGNAARWNVILGDNGTGKTTVLKALVGVVSDFLFSLNSLTGSLARNSVREFNINYSFEIIEDNIKKEDGRQLKITRNVFGNYLLPFT